VYRKKTHNFGEFVACAERARSWCALVAQRRVHSWRNNAKARSCFTGKGALVARRMDALVARRKGALARVEGRARGAQERRARGARGKALVACRRACSWRAW
jgi:hypothetical protein